MDLQEFVRYIAYFHWLNILSCLSPSLFLYLHYITIYFH